MAVGTLAVLAAVTVLTLILRIGRQDVFFQTAVFLEKDLLDKVAVTAERDWLLVSGLSGGGEYYLLPAGGGNFNPIAGREMKSIDGRAYERFFRVSDVSRDSGGEIVSSGGVNDPSTKRADVSVEWQFGGDLSSSSASQYITRSRNFIFRQSDWSGGPNAADPATIIPKNIFFEASSNIDFDSKTGQIKLKW